VWVNRGDTICSKRRVSDLFADGCVASTLTPSSLHDQRQKGIRLALQRVKALFYALPE
jgi:hypothetical protein